MRFVLRLFFAVLRSVLVAVSVTFAGWSGLMTPDPSERAALGLAEGRLSDADRRALKQMRLMRASLAVSPGLMGDVLAQAAPAGTDRAQIDAALRAVANGYRPGDPIPSAQGPASPAPPLPQAPQDLSGRSDIGAKFIQVN